MSSVNFRYRPDLPLVLQDISVQIVGGTKVTPLPNHPPNNTHHLSGGYCGKNRGWQVLLDLDVAQDGRTPLWINCD